jgi:hypothetical protein
MNDQPETWEHAIKTIIQAFNDGPALSETPDDIRRTLDAIESFLGTPLMPEACIGALAFYSRPNRERVLEEIGEMVCQKHYDYGTRNILKYGMHGIEIRVSDKIERARNLLEQGDISPLFESLEDTFADIVGYGLVAFMLDAGWFSLPTERES